MGNTLKVLMVKVGKASEEMEFNAFKSITRSIGIKSGGQWEVLEVAMPGVGIIARDQDSSRLKDNRLGIKGDFALIGLQTTQNATGKTFMFSSLTDEQVHDVRLSLAITTMHDLKEKMSKEELEYE